MPRLTSFVLVVVVFPRSVPPRRAPHQELVSHAPVEELVSRGALQELVYQFRTQTAAGEKEQLPFKPNRHTRTFAANFTR